MCTCTHLHSHTRTHTNIHIRRTHTHTPYPPSWWSSPSLVPLPPLPPPTPHRMTTTARAVVLCPPPPPLPHTLKPFQWDPHLYGNSRKKKRVPAPAPPRVPALPLVPAPPPVVGGWNYAWKYPNLSSSLQHLWTGDQVSTSHSLLFMLEPFTIMSWRSMP